MQHRMKLLSALVMSGLLAACGGGGEGEVSGSVAVDGSSTVYPVSEAVAEEFMIQNPGARVTVGQSGTGAGFQRICAGEIAVTNASRPITDAERERCREAGIELLELPVAWDGLSVVVNPANDFTECLTTQELRRIWQPDSDVRTWRDVRSEWPAEEIRLYGPGVDSGTFDYFTETIVGEAEASRTDYQASEDDNVLVQGVAGDQYALGYFGYAYYAENEGRLGLVAVDGGEGCVEPRAATIEDQSYPLARPLFVYVSRNELARPAVRAFVDFYMENAAELVGPTGYHPLDPERYEENLRILEGPPSPEPGTDTAGRDGAGEGGEPGSGAGASGGAGGR